MGAKLYVSHLPLFATAPKPMSRLRTHYSAHAHALASVLALTGSICTPNANAQTANTVPDNATARRYGGGWECDRGYRRADARCTAVALPANAYLRSFGNDFECARLFRKRDGACVAVVVPPHAYADDSSYGRGWLCEQGYREAENVCVAIVVPANAFAVDFGSGWRCERGFRESDENCEAVMVPARQIAGLRGNTLDSFACSNRPVPHE